MAASKRPAKKTSAAKKTVAKKSTSSRRKSPAQRVKEERERAVEWMTQYRAPMNLLVGWDPDTGEWAEDSPVDVLLREITEKGSRVTAAAKKARIDWILDLLHTGRDAIHDASVSQDRALIPVGVRVFVDLARAIDDAEVEAENRVVGILFDKIADDPRLAIPFLERRFPDGWRPQDDRAVAAEYDPREAAINEMLDDPATAMKLAEIAVSAAERAAELDVEG